MVGINIAFRYMHIYLDICTTAGSASTPHIRFLSCLVSFFAGLLVEYRAKLGWIQSWPRRNRRLPVRRNFESSWQFWLHNLSWELIPIPNCAYRKGKFKSSSGCPQGSEIESVVRSCSFVRFIRPMSSGVTPTWPCTTLKRNANRRSLRLSCKFFRQTFWLHWQLSGSHHKSGRFSLNPLK